MGVLADDKFKPALFLGLGGNGGKIVNLLAGRLRAHPNWERYAPLVHFVAMDTNKADLDALKELRPDCRFLLSNFDAPTYVARKQGHAELDADPLFTQWWPSWYTPRPGMSPGAGQIRIESRLKLYYNLEEDRCGFKRRVAGILDTMTGRENPWRDEQDRSVRVYLYASVAGGTGSGGFLPMAYLMRQLIEDHGWGRPNVTGILSLPTTFLSRVRPELHKDIAANGYAALKELEHLTRTLGYAGGLAEVEFHYDPGTVDPRRTRARGRPFSLTYLIDRPEHLSLEKYEHAVADASYLQIFSPLLGAEAGEYDNYEKHQRTLAQGHFSVNHGSFGTVLLHLPRRDLLRYASLRYVARALSTWLTFGADEPETRVPYGDPAFQRLHDTEKARRIDAAFEQFVALRAHAEEKAEEQGVFTAVHQLRGKGDADLARALRETLGSTWRRLDELITLQPVDPMGINPGNPSIHRTVANLRDDATKARTAVRLFLEAQVAELRSGRFFERFFTEWEVNPIAQRLLLVRTLRGAITPAVPGDGDETDADYAFLSEPGAPVDFDGELVRAEVDKRNQELAATASPGLLSRLTDRDNAAFQAAKRKAVTFVQGLENDLRDELKRTFWRALESELRKVGETMLQAFRKVAEISDDAARLAHSQAERFQADPAAFADSEIGKMYLDAEALRDDRRKLRLWSHLYTHLLDKDAYLDARTLFGVVTAAFQPVRDPDGRSRPRDAAEIVRAVQDQLGEIATRVYARALDDQGLDLARALDLEARYIALLDDGHDLAELRRQARLDDAVRAVSAARVRASVEERLGRVAHEAVLLAHLDATRRDDPTVTPADVLYAGLHDRHTTDDAGSLGGLLRATLPGVNFVQGWKDADSLVLYRAVLGVPLYWFKNVSTVLEPAYRHVMADPHRTYPLHIEADWERDAEGRPGLPDLDPVQVKAAEQRRKAETAARAQADAARARLRQFNLVQLAGGITTGEAGYAWSMAGASGPLGAKRHQAFQAFFALDATLRDLLAQHAQAAWDQRMSDRRARAALSEELAAHQARLTAAFAAAVAADDDAEKRFLADERDTLAAMARAAAGEATGG